MTVTIMFSEQKRSFALLASGSIQKNEIKFENIAYLPFLYNIESEILFSEQKCTCAQSAARVKKLTWATCTAVTVIVYTTNLNFMGHYLPAFFSRFAF